MSGRMAARLAIDLAMTLLLLFSLAYHMTGNTAHEWIGASAFALFAVHTAINRRWYQNLPAGSYPWRRTLNTTVNLLLCVVMITLLVSGLLLSRTVFPFMNASDDMWMRRIHSLASYWGMLLIAVHVGIHWSMVLHAISRMAGDIGASCIRTAIFRILATLICIAGVAASFNRDMGGKLFLGASFDFWDPDRPALLFFAANLAIIGLYVSVTHYLLKAIQRCSENRKT